MHNPDTVRVNSSTMLAVCVIVSFSLSRAFGTAPHSTATLPPPPLAWQRLPSLPDPHGFAGMCGGVSHGALVLAGGANFPGRPPWAGGIKAWHDRTFVLERPDAHWQAGAPLPRPLAYPVSITTERGVLCLGGADAIRHYADVFLLEWVEGAIVRTAMPPLPMPMAYGSGARVGHTVYVAGGTDAPDATDAARSFWSLDLTHLDAGWQVLESWPGRGRMLGVAGVADGSFYLISGVALHAGADGRPVRDYLTDTYRFTPRRGWRRVADVPRPVAAAPGPAATVASRVVVIGGDDGSSTGLLSAKDHPGFSKRILTYDPPTDTWTASEAVAAVVTAPLVPWHGGVVTGSGEVRPGVRSPEVWLVHLTSEGRAPLEVR